MNESSSGTEDVSSYNKKLQKRVYFTGAPSPYEIALCTYGREQGNSIKGTDKVIANTVERILPCIVDGKRVPVDIMREVVHRAQHPQNYKSKTLWQQVLSVACALCMTTAMLTGCGSSNNAGTAATGEAQNSAAASTTTEQASTATDAGTTAGSDTLIALITMDSLDQHWVTLNEGAQKAAAELGVTVQFMAPNTKDDAQQIECVNNAVSAGAQAIIVAANGPDAISSALREASDAGVKLIYVDSPANVSAEATFSTDNNAAGKTAGEEMKKALADAGVTSGSIGIINVNAATDSCVMREEGFRSAFEGTDFELLETQYGEGDAAKSQSIAENYITQGVVGIFGCNEGSTTGAGNAIKASGKDNVIGVGFDKSDAILGLIDDGYLLCTMAQNPDVMGYEGVKAAVKAINGESLGGAVTDTGVSVLTKQQ